MSKTPLIKIFRPGRFTAVDGQQVEFTEADLEQAAGAYDRASDPAPLVVGHPKLDHPAYGWVDKLTFEGGHLVALPADVEPTFADAVRARRFPKVSASFYPPDHPHNPKPGNFYLKHVGFLGAAAPGVKGLGMVSFAEDERDLLTIETSTETNMPPENDTVDFAEREATLTRRETEIANRENAAAERERTAAATVRQALHASNVAFAEGLVASGRLAPAGKELLVGVMDELEATATVSFGETNGDMTPVAGFKKLFEGSQPLIQFGEAARPEDEKDQGGATSFAAPPGFQADPKALEIHHKAIELQSQDSSLSYLDAVVRAGG